MSIIFGFHWKYFTYSTIAQFIHFSVSEPARSSPEVKSPESNFGPIPVLSAPPDKIIRRPRGGSSSAAPTTSGQPAVPVKVMPQQNVTKEVFSGS